MLFVFRQQTCRNSCYWLRVVTEHDAGVPAANLPELEEGFRSNYGTTEHYTREFRV
jgi:hypothetical protein